MPICCWNPGVTNECYENVPGDDCVRFGGAYYPLVPSCDRFDCQHIAPLGACCLPDGSCRDDVSQLDCARLEGEYHGDYTWCSEVDCDSVDPEPPDGCRETRDTDRLPRGGLPWGADLCHNMVMGPTVRRREHRPAPGDEGYDTHRPGYTEIASAHFVRAMDRTAGEEPCRIHFGKLAVNRRGYMGSVACSRPVYGDETTRQASRGAITVENASEPLTVQIARQPRRVTKPGYSRFVGAYHAPYWTEIQYHSDQLRCGAIE